ncbi:MAG: hypothetical protein LVR00_01315 [Rhabdochlamydiaceae bacterium]|jgi:hypothetical protein
MGARCFFGFKPQHLLTAFICFSLDFLDATDVSNQTQLNAVFNGTNPSPANVITPFSLNANATQVTASLVELTSNGSSIDCNDFSLADVSANSTLRLDPSFTISGSVPGWNIQPNGIFQITADQNVASSNQSSSSINIGDSGILVTEAGNILNPINLVNGIGIIIKDTPGATTFSGSIQEVGGTGGFQKIGPGTIRLSNASNTYSGLSLPTNTKKKI